MKIKMLLVAMITMLVVGCASNGDIESLQSQIDVLKTSTATQIEESTVKAGSMCTEHCAKNEKEMNDKLDSLFKKSMTK
jgi:murein lipoprotein